MPAPYLSPGVYVEEVPPLARPIAGVGTSTAGFIGVIPDVIQIPARTREGDKEDDIKRGYKFVDFDFKKEKSERAESGHAYFVTSWSRYTKLFGDFLGDEKNPSTQIQNASVDSGQRRLAHAVYGFFNNGGTGCYVVRVPDITGIDTALRAFAVLDDIAIVAAPGITTIYDKLTSHCAELKDRIAVLDAVESDQAFENGDFNKLQVPTTAEPPGLRPANTTYAAFYFPWIQVSDPAENLMHQKDTSPGNGLIHVPPSGHIAGIYAATDARYGAHKAPANEPAVQGACDLRWALSKADQDNLNDDGVNVIRSLNGAIRIWGARTVGGDANGEFKYISTRRYFNYLRESIDEGTQFVVFEPNSPALWQRIKQSVGDFLLGEWRKGALFGETPEKAFFVKCDADTNPPDGIEAGQVVSEIGVAIVKPAEFVIFRIQQTTGG